MQKRQQQIVPLYILPTIYHSSQRSAQTSKNFGGKQIIYREVSDIIYTDVDHIYTEDIKILSNSPCHHLYGAVTCIKRSPFSCPVIENFT
jgi:hypothetical protein